MPVRTPEPAEQVPVAPMSERLVTEIVEAYAAGQSASAIAAERDLGLRRVQRKLQQNAARVRELRAENQKRESARQRKQDQRARDTEAAADPEAFAAKHGHITSSTRISRKGMLDLYRHEETGVWYRVASVGWDRPATRGDFTRRGAVPPPGYEDELDFGPGHVYPELARHALGYVPPDRKPVRLERTDERGVYRQSPFEAREVEARLAEGWTRVVAA